MLTLHLEPFIVDEEGVLVVEFETKWMGKGDEMGIYVGNKIMSKFGYGLIGCLCVVSRI